MARRVTWGADRLDAGNDFLVPLIGAHTLEDLVRHDPARVFEGEDYARLRRTAHLAFVHPEFVLGGGHQDLRVGKCQRPIGLEQTIDVIEMIMTDDNRIDRARVK